MEVQISCTDTTALRPSFEVGEGTVYGSVFFVCLSGLGFRAGPPGTALSPQTPRSTRTELGQTSSTVALPACCCSTDSKAEVLRA